VPSCPHKRIGHRKVFSLPHSASCLFHVDQDEQIQKTAAIGT